MKQMYIYIVMIVLLLLILVILPSKQIKETYENDLQSVFDNIYINQVWGDYGGGSGNGSEEGNTVKLRNILTSLVKNNNLLTIIDAPCGACVWTKLWLEDLKNQNIKITYYGFDVSKEAINRARANLSHLSNFHNILLQEGNICDVKFPDADLVLCRDALQHLSFNNIYLALHNIASIKAKTYLLGGYLTNNSNINIVDGQYFPINYVLSPFEMKPNVIYSEQSIPNEEQKYLFQFSGLDMNTK